MSQADAVSTRPLPPGVSEAGFARAIDAFTAALGADKVLSSDADLREFRDPFQHATWDAYTASAIVMPTTVEEIQEVLRVANEHKVPLWTHGTGRNNGYGGPAPRVQRLGHREPAQHEPRPRDQRGARLRRRRAGRALVRPLRGDPGRRPPPDALDRRPRLGQRRRQHPRPRRHLHALRRRHGDAVRDGGRAGRRRRSCARAWARCPTTSPGTSTSAVSGRRPISSSCSPTTGS